MKEKKDKMFFTISLVVLLSTVFQLSEEFPPCCRLPLRAPESQIPCLLLDGQYPCPDSPLTTRLAKAPWPQSSATPSSSETMRIMVPKLLQQVSSGVKAASSRPPAAQSVTGGSNRQPPRFPAGYYSLLPSTAARIPISIAFSGDLLPGCPVRHWALVWSAGVCGRVSGGRGER